MMRLRLFGAITIVTIVLINPVIAQNPITAYELRYYNAGAQSAFQTQQLPLGSYQCNQDPILSTIISNPNRAVWDDPSASGRTCIYTGLDTGPLAAFPVGNYEATLVAINSIGTSPESNRAPFVIGQIPAVPTGVHIVR